MGLSVETAVALSTLRETAYNTNLTATGAFTGISPDSPGAIFPQMEKTDDVGRGGREFAGNLCNTYWELPAVQLPLHLGYNLAMAGRLLLRALGGTITIGAATPSNAAAYKHSAPMLPKASGRQLPSSTVLIQNEGDDFLLAGMVINQCVLSQQAADAPIFTVDLIGSGKHLTPIGYTPAAPASDVPCLTGADTEINVTIDAVTADLYDTYDIRSWPVTINNNLITDPASNRRGGDPLDAGGYAHYIEQLKRGSRTVTAEIGIVFGATIPHWVDMAENESWTNLTFRCVGPIFVGTTPYTFEIIIPRATVRAIPGADFNGDAGYTLQIVAMEDSVTMGGATAAVQNGTATAYQ